MQTSDEYVHRAELNIFLVEDNPSDVLLFKHALRQSSISYSLTVAKDGVEAIRRLKNPGGHQAFQPDAVFLDLNLPGKNGAEILAEMKSDPNLAAIPVAILTGSDDPGDHATCAKLGASAYLNKAAALEDFFALMAEIKSFLLSLPRIPSTKNTFGAERFIQFQV